MGCLIRTKWTAWDCLTIVTQVSLLLGRKEKMGQLPIAHCLTIVIQVSLLLGRKEKWSVAHCPLIALRWCNSSLLQHYIRGCTTYPLLECLPQKGLKRSTYEVHAVHVSACVTLCVCVCEIKNLTLRCIIIMCTTQWSIHTCIIIRYHHTCTCTTDTGFWVCGARMYMLCVCVWCAHMPRWVCLNVCVVSCVVVCRYM